MRKTPLTIFAAAIFGLLIVGQSTPASVAAPIGTSKSNSQAALTGKSAFRGHSGHSGSRDRASSGGGARRKSFSREYDGRQGSAGKSGARPSRFAGQRSSLGYGGYGDDRRYDAGYPGSGYGQYQGQGSSYYGRGPYSSGGPSPYPYYGQGPYSSGAGPYYGPSPNYGPGY